MKKLVLASLIAAAPFVSAETDVDALVDQRVEQKLSEYFDSEEFDVVIDEAINRYVVRQQAREREAQKAALREQTKALIPVDETDYVRGDRDARFTLLEFSDYECSFCKRFHDTAKSLLERNDDVNWVYRHYPLEFHNPLAQKQAEAAECVGKIAGSDAFWAYSDAIFERTTSNGRGMPFEELAPIAGELGIDEAAVQACIDSGEMADEVLGDFLNGGQVGVSGTPGNFIIDNKTGDIIPLHGAQPIEALEQAIRALRAEQ